MSGASPLTEQVRTSCLRMCLKTLWHSGKAYHRTSDPLPPYFPVIFGCPDIIHRLQAERNSVARLTGCLFGALVVSRLVDTHRLPIPLSAYDQAADLACIPAILGTGNCEDLLTPHQIRIVNFRKVLSLVLGDINTLFTEEGIRANILNTAQLTFYILTDRLRDSISSPGELPTDQWQLLQEIHSDLKDEWGYNRSKKETAKILDQLRQKLEKLLPAMA
ncbi:hypothetical protein EI94DRAFT_572009 [Lactarius quietus]|nr:hypothetical protein EI94DRAFT_572009 [Lactarius quietus]